MGSNSEATVEVQVRGDGGSVRVMVLERENCEQEQI